MYTRQRLIGGLVIALQASECLPAGKGVHVHPFRSRLRNKKFKGTVELLHDGVAKLGQISGQVLSTSGLKSYFLELY